MTRSIKLIYGYDSLCGWCYGFSAALNRFVDVYPDIEVDVLPGGLFTGHPARPYSSLSNHIKSAEINLERVTGRRPSGKFHAMISRTDCPVAASEPPTHAVLQMKKMAPERTLEFACLLQEVHYGLGKDLNKPETYNDLTKEHGLPDLDTDAIVKATLDDPLVAQSYSACARLGIRSFPTTLVADQNDNILGIIQSIYEPQAFINAFEKLR